MVSEPEVPYQLIRNSLGSALKVTMLTARLPWAMGYVPTAALGRSNDRIDDAPTPVNWARNSPSSKTHALVSLPVTVSCTLPENVSSVERGALAESDPGSSCAMPIALGNTTRVAASRPIASRFQIIQKRPPVCRSEAPMMAHRHTRTL
jgi:hypothetical protein